MTFIMCVRSSSGQDISDVTLVPLDRIIAVYDEYNYQKPTQVQVSDGFMYFPYKVATGISSMQKATTVEYTDGKWVKHL